MQSASIAAGPRPREAGPDVPDIVAPPPRHRRFPLFDGLRAIAVLSVLVVHAGVFGGALDESIAGRLIAHLNIGVTIFFLISGFLLYRPFIAWRAGGAVSPGIPGYLQRRALRIFPAYWLVLLALTVLPGLTGVAGGEWLGQFALLHTLPVGGAEASCVTTILDCGLAQTWSLAVELTFYAALPLYVLAAARLARGRSTARWMASELGLLTLLALISIVATFGIWRDGEAQLWLGGSLLGHVFWFALGMGLAVCSVGLEGRPGPRLIEEIGRRPLVPWLLAGGIYLALSAWLPPTPFLLAADQQLVAHLAFGLIAALLLLPAVFGDERGGAPRRFLGSRPIAWVGLISYGIFLWHYVFALELGTGGGEAGFAVVLAGTLAGSIVVAAASYYLLERPVLRLKRRTRRPAARR